MSFGFQKPYQFQQDDIVKGAVKYIKSLPDVVSLVGSTKDGTPWIFDNEPAARVRGSQSMAIVVRNGGPWASPSSTHTNEFPKLGLDIYSDPPRDAAGQVTKPREARVSADWLSKVLDYYLNRITPGVVMFGDVYTYDCRRLNGISYLPLVQSDDHMIQGTVWYAVECATFYTPS